MYKISLFFYCLKKYFFAAPGPPIIIPEECTSENNSITIAWQPHPSSFVEGYILELDDGNNGAFRVCKIFLCVSHHFDYILIHLSYWIIST